MRKIRVKNATKKGYILIREGGVLDLSFPESTTRRGRVIDEGETTPTLNTGCEVGMVIIDDIYKSRKPRIYGEYAPTIKGGVRTVENTASSTVTRQTAESTIGKGLFHGGYFPLPRLCEGGDRPPKIIVKPCLTPDRETTRQNGRRFKDDGEEAFTLTSQDRHGVLLDDGQVVRIRKLTPKECFRLQGWTDDYFEKAAFVNNDAQLYKQAGNGVTVNVIYAIAEKFENKEKTM